MPALGESGEFALRLSAALADRYEVLREHRRGGMATVYLAVDRKHDRQVALKVLGADLAAGIGAGAEVAGAAHERERYDLPLHRIHSAIEFGPQGTGDGTLEMARGRRGSLVPV